MILRSVAKVLRPPLTLWVLLVSGCDSQVADLREWKASDHEHTSKPSQGQVDVSDEAANPLAKMGISEVALIAWRQNCVRCHGIVGRGDGPQAAMYRPTDLTDAKRQAQLTDADLVTVIKNGRGKMPGFKLPEPTIQGLVRLLRLLDASGKGLNAIKPTGSASGAPSASPAPNQSAASAGSPPAGKSPAPGASVGAPHAPTPPAATPPAASAP